MRSAADYLSLLQALLPPGDAWPRDPGATLTTVLGAMAPEFALDDARADDLLNEADPRTTTEMLSDWETALGLPDCCAGPASGLAARRQQVVAKLTSLGGQSPAWFVSLAANYGFAITVTVFPPFTTGSGCDDVINGGAWNYAWQVNAGAVPVTEMDCDALCDDPLQAWGLPLLECVIKAAAPAHTTVIFAYGASDAGRATGLGFNVLANSGLAAGVV
jgi:uncharacterized protein YmfQ (DUF2313 family)